MTASAVHALLLGVATVVAVTVGVEAAALERSRSALRWVVAASGGLAIAAYVVGAVVWEQQLTARAGLAHPAYAGATALAGVAVIAVALLAWRGVRLHPGSHHPIATLVSSTSLAPQVTRSPRVEVVPSASLRPTGARNDRELRLVRETVEMAGTLMGPAWPLRATVAVNPLAGLEILPFDTALSLAEQFHRAPVRPSFSWFLDLYDHARISEGALAQAMDRQGLGEGSRGVQGLVELTRRMRDQPDQPGRPGEPDQPGDADSAGTTPAHRAFAHAHLWSARAWHRAEDRSADLHGPWELWRRSAGHPAYRLVSRTRDADAFAASLPEDPAHAILDLLDRADHPRTDLFRTVAALLAVGPGWVAHAQWRARRSGSISPLVELVALRLAHLVLHGAAVPAAPTVESTRAEGPLSCEMLKKIWLDALDRTTQDQLCDPLVEPRPDSPAAGPAATRASSVVNGDATSQSVWCIDVRSERIRRHLESTGAHETFGFAGFFGLTGRVTHPDGTSFDQCPVIVAPTLEIRRPRTPLRMLPAMTRTTTRVAARPGLSFAVAEASGLAAFAAALIATCAPRTWRRVLEHAVLERSGPAQDVPAPTELRDLADPDRLLSIREQADAAEAMLRTIGLTERFAPVLVLAGHGSTTENNAYATAYDCGACGGNPGLINAHAMAQVLNDPDVRSELASRGLRIPDATRAMAALHDTATDQVTLHPTSPADVAVAERLAPDFTEAGRRTAAERRATLPADDRRSGLVRRGAETTLAARASDWSEPMPEWGLAGCAAIIVGPRDLTRHLDLSGRTFLHSYDRHHDPDGAILTAILNAPVVVSQWIASQYWFSSVAPTTLGAGDKTTHNVLGDIGVLTGAHGDLRVGLPWQALFARDPGTSPDLRSDPQHIPSRHLVIVDADPLLLARAVRRSPVVLALLVHDWMRLVALDRGRVTDIADVLADETDHPDSGRHPSTRRLPPRG